MLTSAGCASWATTCRARPTARVLDPMIQVSDNDAAARPTLGRRRGPAAVAQAARMRDLTVPGTGATPYFSAADQARSLLSVRPAGAARASRSYARKLLSSIVSYQRWGFSRFSLRRGWHTFFKGGWRTTGRGSLVHEAALFERRGRRFSMVVLTDGNPSHDYGTETLRGVARAHLQVSALDRAGAGGSRFPGKPRARRPRRRAPLRA